MSDHVCLRGVRVHGRHGVLPEERAQGQDFVVDVDLELDTSAAAASDDLADTVDYAALAARISAIVSGEPVNLLETLAQRLADVCLSDSRVRAATVSVHKPQAPVGVPFDDVVVTVTRTSR